MYKIHNEVKIIPKKEITINNKVIRELIKLASMIDLLLANIYLSFLFNSLFINLNKFYKLWGKISHSH